MSITIRGRIITDQAPPTNVRVVPDPDALVREISMPYGIVANLGLGVGDRLKLTLEPDAGPERLSPQQEAIAKARANRKLIAALRLGRRVTVIVEE